MSAPARPTRLPDLRGLARTLDAQDRALGRGDLAVLPDLVTRISGLCDRLDRHDTPPTSAEAILAGELRQRADRGLRSIAAVLAGLRDAQALLEVARNARTDATYGPRGQRLTMADQAGRLERRT
jgi:hypothetical protein